MEDLILAGQAIPVKELFRYVWIDSAYLWARRIDKIANSKITAWFSHLYSKVLCVPKPTITFVDATLIFCISFIFFLFIFAITVAIRSVNYGIAYFRLTVRQIYSRTVSFNILASNIVRMILMFANLPLFLLFSSAIGWLLDLWMLIQKY
jgi:hypothetical protein